MRSVLSIRNLRTQHKLIAVFVAVLILKITQAIYIAHLLSCSAPDTKIGWISFASGDTHSYTGAMENYIQHGVYYFFNGKENVYAGRMPHYSIPYFLFRQVLNKESAYDLLTFFQILVECIALVWLVYCVHRYHRSIFLTGILITLLIVSSNWTIYSLYASPESLSCSLLVLTLCEYYKLTKKWTTKNVLMIAFLLGILITLKPYFALLFLPIGFQLLLDSPGSWVKKLKRAMIKSAILIAPLLMFITPWILRNYIVYNRFVPFQINATAGYNYSAAELAFRKFVSSWGGDYVHWEKTSAGCYFKPSPEIQCSFSLPAYVITSAYSRDDIEVTRAQFIELQKNYSDSLNMVVSRSFDNMTESFKEEKPIRYRIIAPLILTKKFLVHSGSYYLPIHASNPCFQSFQLIIKISQSGLYWASLVLGFIGVIMIGVRLKSILLPSVPILLIILFPLVLRAAEARYFRTAEPVLYVGVVYVLRTIIQRFKVMLVKPPVQDK